MNWPEIKLVSWDVDGTLYSVRQLKWELVKIHARECLRNGWSSPDARDLRAIARFHQALAKRKTSVSEEAFRNLDRPKIRGLEAIWFPRALAKIEPRAESLRWLRHFQKSGVRQATLSNFDAEPKLRTLDLLGFFEKNVSCERGPELKPSPAPFQELRRDFGVSSHEHLHIGDRPDLDGRGASGSGAAFIDVRELSRLPLP